jgi:DNA-binding MarR family transcriptional regulator
MVGQKSILQGARVAKKIKLEKITLDEHRLWVLLRQTYYLITQCEENASNGTGVTAQQLVVLWLMQFISNITNKPIIITDLAPSLYRSVNSISTIIDRMEKNGLVKKIRDLPDRRSVRLQITPAGEKKYIEALKPNREMIKRLLSVYSDEELETFIRLLRKLKKKATEEPYIEELTVDPELSDPAMITDFLNKVI